MKSDGVDMVKESVPSITIFSGGMMTLTPITIFQVIGAIGIFAGIVLGGLRWKEAKRANDLTEKKLELEYAKSKDGEKASEKESSHVREEETST